MAKGLHRRSGEPLTNISYRFKESAQANTELLLFLANLSEAVRLVHLNSGLNHRLQVTI